MPNNRQIADRPRKKESSSRAKPRGYVQNQLNTLKVPAWTILVLRAFLGFTFLFAGLQKIANPQFFNAKFSGSIQAQMEAFTKTSPIGPLLSHLVSHAAFIGLLIALSEMAVGIGTLLGLFTRIAALGGMAISFTFFLTVSFHDKPYYTGADIVFFFAWTPLLLGGSANLFAIDAYLQKLKTDYSSQRRSIISTLVVAIGSGAILLAGADALIGRIFAKPLAEGKSPTLGGQIKGSSTTTLGRSGNSGSPGGSNSANGTLIGPASDVSVGGAATFTDPISGDPAFVYRPSDSKFLAFDAVCPHAGCTVSPMPSQKIAQCPCHGSTFDLSTGQVLSGPAPTGLSAINVNDQGGQLYVTD
jgi:thiosulfate dehydrogenase [quinone] large subunit